MKLSAILSAALLASVLLSAPLPGHTQTSAPPPGDRDSTARDSPGRDSTAREPTARELGETMGKVMGQMGQMLGDMAQTMGGSMQRMLDAVQKEAGLRDRKNEHIEGKLAFLKAELQIAPAQESAWNAFADSMRKAAAMKLPVREGGGATLPERMEDQMRALEAQLAVLQAKQAAIDKLYAQLDAKQKTLADDLIGQIGLV